MRLVATDGHRLAKVDIEAPETTSESSAIIPQVLFDKLTTNFKDFIKDDKFEVSINENSCFFKLDNCIIETKLIQGYFPKYMDVIPEAKNTIKLDFDDFKDKLKMLPKIPAKVDFGSLALDIKSAVVTLIQQWCDDDNWVVDQGGHLAHNTRWTLERKIFINPRFLLDYITTAKGTDLDFSYTTPNKPLLFRSEDKDLNLKSTYVLMPVDGETHGNEPKEIEESSEVKTAA